MPDPGPTVRLAAPSLRGVVRLVGIVAVCAIGLYLVWRTRGVLRLAAIALFVALTLQPIVDALERRVRVPRAAAILLLYAILAGGIVVTGAVVVPSTVRQVKQLSRDAPTYLHDLRRNPTFRRYDDRYAITPKLRRDANALPARLQRAAGPLQRVTVQAFGVVSQLLTVLSLAFLLMLHGREYMGMALRLTGAREARYRALVIEINRAVAKYMLGNVAISGLATVSTWLVLTLLGVPYALSLGLLVGFFDLIPLIGATLGAIFVGVATATVDFPTATLVWIAFIIIYQRVENSFIQPVVYGRALKVNPIVTILAVLIGASLLGILGALLAIPIAAAIQILLRSWFNQTHTSKEHIMSNDELRTDVEQELFWEPRVDNAAIAVAADEGRVTLRGTVGSFREKREAAGAAKRVFGVTKVDDELSVRLLDGDRRDDADVRGGVLQALMLDAMVPSSIDASVADGIVTLRGVAPYNYQRAEAEFVAGNVPGVLAVDDEIELTIADPTPSDVRQSIHKAFRRDASLDADALSIDTFDGTVTLAGHVESWIEHDAAVNAAWSAPGVRTVEDQIVVDY